MSDLRLSSPTRAKLNIGLTGAKLDIGGVPKDHGKLQNLDFENSGHTGFQKELTPEQLGAIEYVKEEKKSGKVLSTNDFTDAYVRKITSIMIKTDTNKTNIDKVEANIDEVEANIDEVEANIDELAAIMQYYGTVNVTPTNPYSFEFDSSTGTITGYTGTETDVVIPYEINGVKVNAIGNGAFSEYASSKPTSLTSVIIPNSVTSIGQGAFSYCSNLTSITIPSSVTSINMTVFSGCSSLTSITIPDSVTSIGQGAFINCSSLTSITIPNSVTSIGLNAFTGCTSLISVTIPNSVASIEGGVFKGCTSLISVTIPNSITRIEAAMFDGCTNLTSVIFSTSVKIKTVIKEGAFKNCTNLTDVYFEGTQEQWSSINISNYNEPLLNATIHYEHIPTTKGYVDSQLDTKVTKEDGRGLSTNDFTDEYKERIDTDLDKLVTNQYYGDANITPTDPSLFAFEPLTGTITGYTGAETDVVVPYEIDGVKVVNIGVRAFDTCKFKSVILPNSVTLVNHRAFNNCINLTNVIMPDSVTTFGDGVFAGCRKLVSVVIPNGVTTIGSSFFSDCTLLERVTIPDSVTSIGQGAFINCSNLTDVYFEGTQEQWSSINISNYNEPLLNATIHYEHIPTTKGYVDSQIGNKVDKEEGKGLSTNDFTDEYKERIEITERVASVNQESLDGLNYRVDEIEHTANTNSAEINSIYATIVDNITRIETLETNVGDIETALDNIIAIQNRFMGGDA